MSIRPVPWKGRVPGYQAPGIVVSQALSKDRDSKKYLYSKGIALVSHLSELGDLLSHYSSVVPNANGEVVLVPGTRNAHGVGVYFAEVDAGGRAESACECEYVISRRQAQEAGVSFDDAGWPKANTGIRLHIVGREVVGGTTRYYCVVREVLDAVETGMVRTAVFTEGGKVTARSLRVQRSMKTPSQCLGLRYWLAGKVLALVCFVKALTLLRTSFWSKWFALGWFLAGFGGTWRLPSSICRDWNSGVVKCLDDNRMFIRPSANTTLFWIVGGMTVQNKGDGTIEGEDVYDFHPQMGQNTIIGDGCYTWAWSGGENDPTQVPSEVKGVNLYNLVGKLVPKLRYRYIREHNGRLLFSNDLWNALGGRPFTSIVRADLNQNRVSYDTRQSKIKAALNKIRALLRR